MPTGTTTSFPFDVSDIAGLAIVPDNDIARLMYYLNCVTSAVGLHILQDDLIAYRQYQHLSNIRSSHVIQAANKYGPNEYVGKVIFCDDDNSVTKNSGNKFVTIGSASAIVSVDKELTISGRTWTAKNVMFFKSAWLARFYTEPMARVYFDTNHCRHCEGKPCACACLTCPRTPESQCHPLHRAPFEMITTDRHHHGSSISEPSNSQPANG